VLEYYYPIAWQNFISREDDMHPCDEPELHWYCRAFAAALEANRLETLKVYYTGLL
jgi:hypothetical protein